MPRVSQSLPVWFYLGSISSSSKSVNLKRHRNIYFRGPHEVITQILSKAELYLPPNFLVPLEAARDYFAKANETTTSPSVAEQWIQVTIPYLSNSGPLKKARGYHPLVDQGFTYVEPYTPNLNKQNVIFLLLLLLCYEGCSALAVIIKPIFTFILNLLPIGNRWPKKNTHYLLSLKKAKKDMV